MDTQFLQASDGTGEAVIATITADRAIASTTLLVDSVNKWPDEFIITTGTQLSSGYLDASDMCIMRGHLSGTDIVIDSYAPGYTDVGNTVGQKAIIKPTTDWANKVATALEWAGDALGGANPVKFVVSATEPPAEAGKTIIWFEPV